MHILLCGEEGAREDAAFFYRTITPTFSKSGACRVNLHFHQPARFFAVRRLNENACLALAEDTLDCV